MNQSNPYKDFYQAQNACDPSTERRAESNRPDRSAMKKRKKKLYALSAARGIVQLISFLLIPGLFITVFSGIGAIWTAIITGTFVLSEQLVNILTVTAVLLMTIVWGRFFCGWLCSFGAMQDLLRFLGRRLVKRNIVPEKADRILKYLKYAVLLFIVVAVWTLGVGANTVWSPWTVFGMYASPWNGLPAQAAIFSIGGGLLLLAVVGSVFIDRFFCRYFCPLGAIFSLLSRFRIFKVKKPSASCSGSCRGCTKSCPMGVSLYKYDEIRSGECIDCLKCTAVCHRDNVKLETLPAVSGTVAAMALMGVTFAGTLIPQTDNSNFVTTTSVAEKTSAGNYAGNYKDGVYQGAAAGFRGDINVSVTVANGNISDITVVSSSDDKKFLNKAQESIIPAIIEAQDTDVDTVSGATFSSRGIIGAVENAIGDQKLTSTETATVAPRTEAPTEAPETDAPEAETPQTETPETEAPETEAPAPQGQYADGVYTGYGSGFRGTTAVSVTGENGMISDITVLSYEDDDRFFNNAEYGVIANILSAQSVDVDTVSGATFSSNSIKEAVADALGLSFENPNSTMSGGHGHH